MGSLSGGGRDEGFGAAGDGAAGAAGHVWDRDRDEPADAGDPPGRGGVARRAGSTGRRGAQPPRPPGPRRTPRSARPHVSYWRGVGGGDWGARARSGGGRSERAHPGGAPSHGARCGRGVSVVPMGVCLDALNPTGRPEAGGYPFAWARLAASTASAFLLYSASLEAAGVDLAIVLDQNLYQGTGEYLPRTAAIAAALRPRMWVVGNEMDAGLLPEPSPSSWAMGAVEYADLFLAASAAIRAVDPAARIVMGGFVSGQPDAPAPYLSAIRARGGRVDGIDVHPYGKDAAGAAVLLAAYRALGLP